jgi:hypothetical protein
LDSVQRNVLINFDERVTSSDKIIEQLAAKGYSITGGPRQGNHPYSAIEIIH